MYGGCSAITADCNPRTSSVHVRGVKFHIRSSWSTIFYTLGIDDTILGFETVPAQTEKIQQESGQA
jgi:hypothetical protein